MGQGIPGITEVLRVHGKRVKLLYFGGKMSEKDIYNNKLKQLEKKVVRNTLANTRDMA